MLTLINADDWEALYLDDNLVAQDHAISVETFAAALKDNGIKFVQRETTERGYDYLYDHGEFPDSLKETEAMEREYAP